MTGDLGQRAVKRFLQYVQVDTRSVDHKGDNPPRPSSQGQVDLACAITDELASVEGFSRSWLYSLEDGSFLVVLPVTEGYEQAPHVVFASHLDTYFGFSGAAHPIVHEYHGGDIALPENGVVIPASDLTGLEGERIITADGTSLLGGDDKAGDATLVTAIEEIVTQGIPHGPLTFWFCTDEEIGKTDVSVVPPEFVQAWKIFWTVDGKEVGNIDTSCFSGRKIVVTFTGEDAHPGEYPHKLRPAHYAAMRFLAALELTFPTPMDVGRSQQSFCYVANVSGNAARTEVVCYPRSFSTTEVDVMARTIIALARQFSEKLQVHVEATNDLLYVNIDRAIRGATELLAPAFAAHSVNGFPSVIQKIRGGTDGAMLNLKCPTLPAPNMGTGARNLHGPQEFVAVEELEALPAIVLDMIRGYAQMRA